MVELLGLALLSMVSGTDPSTTVETERRVLQALCQGTQQGSVREIAGLVLAVYHWREPLHQVIFEVLIALPTEDPVVVRDQLLPLLTRRGFPDVNINEFFESPVMSKREAERLIRQLGDSVAQQS